MHARSVPDITQGIERWVARLTQHVLLVHEANALTPRPAQQAHSRIPTVEQGQVVAARYRGQLHVGAFERHFPSEPTAFLDALSSNSL